MSVSVRPDPADRRVRRTREALHSALLSLIARQGFETTSVQQVLDEADIGRSTFYAHFSGKEELLRYGFTRLRQELDRVMAAAAPTPFGFVPPLLDHARAHAGLYAALLGGTGGIIAREETSGIVHALMASELADSGLAGARRDFAATFLTAGFLAALEAWLARPSPEGARQLLEGLRGASDGLTSGGT